MRNSINLLCILQGPFLGDLDIFEGSVPFSGEHFLVAALRTIVGKLLIYSEAGRYLIKGNSLHTRAR